ncbi:MAG: hypothetical protein ACR2NZ_00820 [Rubripirellula sp.]
MKIRTLQVMVAAVAAVTLIATTASADQVHHGSERIVGEQVVGDTSTGTTVSDSGTYVGDVSRGRHGGSYNAGMIVQRSYGRPDLFYNYYTQGFANRANAQMYLSPVPVPPNVGHTFYTYQPFHPHHMLYWHKNRFHRHYDFGRGMNRTRAVYYSPPVRQAASNFYWNILRIPR